MKFHDDLDKTFKPLVDYVSDTLDSEEELNETVGQYMYMFHDDEDTYHYKHFGTREYLKIKNDGKVEGRIEDWRKW